MGFSEIVSFMQSFEIPLVGVVTPELALFGLSVAFFGFSTAVCAMAVSAANKARATQADAKLMMRTTQDYAVEMRQLAERAEKSELAAAASVQQGLAERLNSVNVGGAGVDTDETRVELSDGDEDTSAALEDSDASAAANDVDDANARLADAGRAASEPRSLLSSMLRRR